MKYKDYKCTLIEKQAIKEFAENLKKSIRDDSNMCQLVEDCALYPEDFICKIDEFLKEYDK